MLNLERQKRQRIEAQALSFEALKKAPKLWRIKNLYWVLDRNQQCVRFVPYDVQWDLFKSMHTRDVILKARKRGFSTGIQIWMLDSALFQEYFRGMVIAQDKITAAEIFRDKFRFAYDRLPATVLAARPLVTDSSQELVFPNGSAVRVSTSGRGGTPNFVHVSEFGKIAAASPKKAREIITGTFPSVPTNGHIIVESTADGQAGEFATLAKTAQKAKESGALLTPIDFKFHFYSWWDEADYQVDPAGVVITKEMTEYFELVESKIGREISLPRRAWYVKTLDNVMGGEQEIMWQEHPSFPDEAFQVSVHGCYYAQQFKKIRAEKRICKVPYDPQYPVMTFWDIGNTDGTAIWCIQQYRHTFGVIDFFEGWDDAFQPYIESLKDTRYVWSTHYLPHDADHERQQGRQNKSAKMMLEELAPNWNFEIVPRIATLDAAAINQVRDVLALCAFDEERTAKGLVHLESYRKEWDSKNARWKDRPRHDEHSEAADAFRIFAQARASNLFGEKGRSAEPEPYPDYF